MARRFSAEDKGKSITGNPMAPPRIRVRAPEFDPSELTKEKYTHTSWAPYKPEGTKTEFGSSIPREEMEPRGIFRLRSWTRLLPVSFPK